MGRTYGQYCPIAKAAEVLAERWTPLIIRNLALDCHRFGEILEGCPRMSTTLLTDRLRSLQRAGVVLTRPAEDGRGKRYYLTAAGEELAEVVLRLGGWGERWLEIAPADRDPFLAVWSWARMTAVEALPTRRVIVRFEIIDHPKERLWLLLQRPRPEVCVTYPGAPEDLLLRTDLATLVDVQRGALALSQARRGGQLSLTGDAWLVAEFSRWGGVSQPLSTR